jgi:NADPH2:quinone reductase
MRAVVMESFGGIEAAAVKEFPEPACGTGQVLVEVHTAPVNYVDLLVIAGKYQFLPPLPFVPGKGPAGRIIQLGPGVANLKVGDRVLAMAESGGYAERAVAAADQCYALPEAITYDEAGSMSLAYDTAWMALHERGRLARGESVLVLGASGAVGSAAVQLAKAFGATVLAGVSRPEAADAARAAGADAIVDLSVKNLRDALRDQVRAATGGIGADVILDPVGGDVFSAALRALAWRGRLVVIGFAGGTIPTVAANYLLVKNIEVSGLQISDYRKRRPDLMARCFGDIFGLHAQGSIHPQEVEAYPLDQAGTALRQVRDRRSSKRIVLHPRP